MSTTGHFNGFGSQVIGLASVYPMSTIGHFNGFGSQVIGLLCISHFYNRTFSLISVFVFNIGGEKVGENIKLLHHHTGRNYCLQLHRL
ncbi:hypothetical protein FKM82_026161 [Ascaphus truei]